MKRITQQKYIFGDFDKDGIKNIDDAYPYSAKGEGRTRYSEVNLSDELQIMRRKALSYKDETRQVRNFFTRLGYKTKSRIKATRSIINKLRRKYLNKIEDFGGVTVFVRDESEARHVAKIIRKKYRVIDVDDYYKKPKGAYGQALHYTVEVRGKPVEIQIKTAQASRLHKLIHTEYKKGGLR